MYQYCVVKSYSLEEFTKEVEERLNKGWELRGDLLVMKMLEGICYCQPMIRCAAMRESFSA